VNPISATSWLWKALRGHSVTFAVLMAFGLLGFSVIRWVKLGLHAVGAPWLLVLVLPGVFIGLLARWEHVWIPDEAKRKFWARGILGGSVFLVIAMAYLKPEPPVPADGANVSPTGSSQQPVKQPVRPRGPSGK
jgi:hypothetical protein